MTEQTTITLQQLQGMAKKITEIERPKDFRNCTIDFTDEEKQFIDAFRPIVEYAVHEELFRLNQKINNHHHVTLSVNQSMEFKDELHAKKQDGISPWKK